MKIYDQEQLVFHLYESRRRYRAEGLLDAVVILCEQLGAHFLISHCVLYQFIRLLIRQLTIAARVFLDVGD